MKSYRIIASVLLSVCAMKVWAQDPQLFAERDIAGTARYVSMSGAMAAVGADPSAVLDNPAGLGLYRRMEVSLTLHGALDYNKHEGEKSRLCTSFMLPQTSLVFALENRNQEKALRFCNFMFSFNRIKFFNRSSMLSYTNAPSIANLMLEQVDRGDAGIITESDICRSLFNSSQTGWLSELGYWGCMINPLYEVPTPGDTVQTGWISPYDQQDAATLRMEESGYVDEYVLNWAGNISNRVYIGVGLNIRSLYYSKKSTYGEIFPLAGSMQQVSSVRQTGVGVSGTFGVIYQPLRFLRAGLSLQTPTATRVSTSLSSEMTLNDPAYDPELNAYASTLVFSGTDHLTQPMRLTAGLAFLMQNKGLLALQYDYRHGKNTMDIHTLKVGSELVLINNLFLNMGYACESSFAKTDPVYVLAKNDVRTDPEFRSVGIKHFASAGIGYRGNNFVAQLAYQFGYQSYNLTPFAVSESDFYTAPEAMKMRDLSHRIVLTIAWHTR